MHKIANNEMISKIHRSNHNVHNVNLLQVAIQTNHSNTVLPEQCLTEHCSDFIMLSLNKPKLNRIVQ